MSKSSCSHCSRKWKAGDAWVGCGSCKKTYHGACVNLAGASAEMLAQLTEWKCDTCYKPRNTSTETAGDVGDLVQQLLSSEALKTTLVKLLEEKLPELVRKVVRDEVAELVKEEVKKAIAVVPPPSTTAPSFADILKSGSPSGPVARLAQMVRREEEAHEEKKDRLVFRGLQLDAVDTSRDEETVRTVAEELGVAMDGVRVEIRRLGKKDGPTLLSAKIPTPQRSEILRASQQLKDSVAFKNVYINPDRTPGERHADYLLRCELKQKRTDQPARRWVISKGKVVEKVDF